jgi:RimJ/RimL family protein N-acetyltransferase
MPSFECLYYFTSQETSVLEIKRTDLSTSAPLSERYKWLMVSQSSEIVCELDFKSMQKNESEEIRNFIEGEFRFKSVEGYLSLLGRNFCLKRKNQEQVCEYILKVVNEYLSDCQLMMNSSLRSLKPSDVNYFKKWILDKEVIRYSMTKFHKISNDSQIIDWYQTSLFDPKTFQLGIIDSASKVLIGYAGIASINEVDGNGEYFIFIGDKSYWGKGIASSVTKEIVKIGFQDLKLHRIFLTASNRNPGAIRAYEKAGFVHEGRMRKAFFRNNEYSDKIFMGILSSEFEAGTSF